jgi:hypothetical protein
MLNKLDETSKIYIDKFFALKQIHILDRPYKLGVYDNKLYINWYYLESLQRSYYSDSKEVLITYLEREFSDYEKFYNNLINNFNTSLNKYSLAEIVRLHKREIISWNLGLHKIAIVYNNVKTIKSRILYISNRLEKLNNKKIY